MKLKKWIVPIISGAFILLNCYALTREFIYLPLFSGALVLLYLLFFKVDILIYLMALSTPFSYIIEDAKIDIGVSVPSEIIMISLTFLFFMRVLYDLKVDKKI